MNRTVPLKTSPEVARMRHAAQALERIFAELALVVEPGVSPVDLERVAMLALKRYGLRGVLQGYEGFPSVICASVNNVAAHGVPDATPLSVGDILTIDISAAEGDWYADAAWTYGVGELGNEQRRLIRAAWRATIAGARAARAGRRMGDIGAAIGAEASRAGCSVVREFVGHGIGVGLHEEPAVPHAAEAGTGEPIVPGMVLNIEPVLTLGNGRVTRLHDGWGYATADGALAAQFEVTVAVRAIATEVLTLSGNAAYGDASAPPYG